MKGKIKSLLKKLVLIIYRLFTHILLVRKNVVVFMGSLGRSPYGSPRAICDELVKQGLDKKYRLYYILDNPDKAVIQGKVRKIKNARLKFYYIMAVAGTWISDTRFQNYIVKRNGVRYIQTWHGTPLKKLALDMESVSMAENTDISSYRKEFVKNSSTWDYLISQNPFSTETFRRAFAFKGEILEYGYPRNDVLFYGNNTEYIKKLKEKYNIPQDKRVMLYAPTWRDDKYHDSANYKFETELDFGMMKKYFSDEWVLLAKYHYMVKDNNDYEAYNGFVIPMRAESDIAELYLMADILITDYSSAMFDYSILKRPVFFYVFDYDNYKDSLRGFYFDLMKEAPGPVVQETALLAEEIKKYTLEEKMYQGSDAYIPAAYQAAYETFVTRYNPYDNGNASKRIVGKFFH